MKRVFLELFQVLLKIISKTFPSKFALFTILYMELYTKSSLAEFNTQ